MSSRVLVVIFACAAACGGHDHGGGHDARHDAGAPDAAHADAPHAGDAAHDAPHASDAAHDASHAGDAAHDASMVTDAARDASMVADAARDASMVADAHGAEPDAHGTEPDAHMAPADAAHADAAHPDAALPDAGTKPDAGGVTVACYSEGSPGATCMSPDHCCFTNYGSYHDGTCATSTCSWGTIDCDGPEDCGAGQNCCSHAIYDPAIGVIGYQIACQAGACGTPPFDQELCHSSATCPAGESCVTAYGHDNDLPRALSICQ